MVCIFFLSKVTALSLAKWMIFQIFKETIAENIAEREFYLVQSPCNVCDNFTWLLKKSAMPNTTARTVPSPTSRSFSYQLESPSPTKWYCFWNNRTVESFII